eukprot:CAMPEP_0118851526 /NCGR_PEP_ID=MMETSP1163-20130328/944_1 /TAXON_ID=124430 /ORGANISM="Phaeomonas parva, Strain CCMP2877" /LENGTH=283 /DNA_ID=CAMNT_0006783883 /DNA_START=32 /DNA_END=883 /DNA_ORIENTATION=-
MTTHLPTPAVFPYAVALEGDAGRLQHWRAQYGADLDAALSFEEWTPLQLASARGDLAAVDALLAAGASAIRRITSPVLPSLTPLHLSVRYGHFACMQRLLDAGAEVGATDRQGFAALHYAAYAGNADAVRYLLEHGALANARSLNGCTARDIAVKRSMDDCVALLERFETRAEDYRHEAFRRWLDEIGAGAFFHRFLEAGYDIRFVAEQGLDDADLDCVGVPESRRGVRRKLIVKHQLEDFLDGVGEGDDEDEGDDDDDDDDEEDDDEDDEDDDDEDEDEADY